MKLRKFKGLIELVVAHLVIVEKRKTDLLATKILVPGGSAAGTSTIPISASSFETPQSGWQLPSGLLHSCHFVEE